MHYVVDLPYVLHAHGMYDEPFYIGYVCQSIDDVYTSNIAEIDHGHLSHTAEPSKAIMSPQGEANKRGKYYIDRVNCEL